MALLNHNLLFMNHPPRNTAQFYTVCFINTVHHCLPYEAMSYLLYTLIAYEQVEKNTDDIILPALVAVGEVLDELQVQLEEVGITESVLSEDALATQYTRGKLAFQLKNFSKNQYLESEFHADHVHKRLISDLFEVLDSIRKGLSLAGLSVDALDEALRALSGAIKDKADRYFETAQDILSGYESRLDEVEQLFAYYHLHDTLRLTINTLLLGMEPREEEEDLQYMLEELLGHRFATLFEREVTLYA